MLLNVLSGNISVEVLLSWVVALIVAITVHEFSHAFTADKLGDPTPRYQGRVTLNPLKHLDPIGTLMILIAPIGWGKPVPFNPWNLKNPRQEAAIISLAGPTANLAMAIASAILIRMELLPFPFDFLLLTIVVINISLAVFNLIPVAPLDGFKLIGGLLPRKLSLQWESLEQYGVMFLILLIVPIGGTSLAESIILPIRSSLIRLFLGA